MCVLRFLSTVTIFTVTLSTSTVSAADVAMISEKVVKPFLSQFCDRTSRTYQAQAGVRRIREDAERRKLERSRHSSSSSEENCQEDEDKRR